jgi:hypothetical protein
MADTAMSPPDPSDRAAAIVGAVAAHVELDLAPIRDAVRHGLAGPSEEFVCERAERIAAGAIETLSADELLEQCERGLGEAHESFLITAERCREAAEDLARNGSEAWIARAIRHRLAFDAAWDAMTETGHVVEMEWNPGED